MLGGLPVDLNLCKKKVVIVSKCNCCVVSPQVESLTRLFFHSEAATQLWNRFAGHCCKVGSYTSLSHLWATWGEGVFLRNQAGVCCLGVLVFTCWELWKARSRAFFENVPMRVAEIFRAICRDLLDMFSIYKPKSKANLVGCLGLQQLLIPVQQPRVRMGKWLKWVPPIRFPFKLNTDGSIIDGVCTGGGIIRDGSKVAVSVLVHNHSSPWMYAYELRVCRSLLSFSCISGTESCC